MKPAPPPGICFHCGESIPPKLNLSVVIDGEQRPVCCVGCQSVALLIAGADMAAFYRQRTDFAPQPTDTDQDAAEWFQDSDWVDSFSSSDSEGNRVIPLLVSGMSCAACTWLIERFLREVDAVVDVDVNLNLARVRVTLKASASPRDAVATIGKLGYGVRPWRTDARIDALREESRRDLRRLGVAGLGMMQVGMFAIALHAGDLQGMDTDLKGLLRGFSAPIALAVVLYSGRSFFFNAWQHLKQGALVMDSSVALALLLATVASLWATIRGTGETYYDSVTMFIFFLLLARYVEKRLRDADFMALVRLEDALPEFVAVRRGDSWQRVPRTEIAVGETVRVPPGESIAFDATVVSGHSAVDEAVFTGESVPRRVTAGDGVFAGTINTDASLDLIVDTPYPLSRLASLQRDVEQAQSQKPAYLRLIDRIAARFVAFVLAAAALTALGWWYWDPSRALWSALAVLVVACPCALSLATPAALASATSWLRRNGVLVRGEYGLLAAAEADTVLIDKTGTLTETRFRVDAVKPQSPLDAQTLVALASSLQQFSQHPAALPFHGQSTLPGVEAVEPIPGHGMQGIWQGARVRLGSATFCAEMTPVPPAPDDQSYWLALASEQRFLGWIGLAESLRAGADTAIAGLQQQVSRVVLVSGDQSARVEAVASQLGIDWVAGCLPAEKLAVLEAERAIGRRIIAIGDGLNDAPLLTAADASIAVAGATSLTQAQADFAVTEDDLLLLPAIVKTARRTRRIIRENLVWAAGYNALGIPFAAAGFVPPWLAAVGMSLSSLIVVLNALRLRRQRR